MLAEAPLLDFNPGTVPPSQEVIDHEIAVEAQVLDNELAAFQGNESDSPTGEANSIQASRLRTLGRAALIRGGLEVLGAGVDTLLIAGGSAHIVGLGSMLNREAIATTGDVAILSKIQGEGGEVEQTKESRMRRVGRKLGSLALTVSTAILAQKVGVSIAEHFSPNLNTGVGAYAIPIASKVSAIAGVGKAAEKLGL